MGVSGAETADSAGRVGQKAAICGRGCKPAFMGRDAVACIDACRQYAIPARADRRGYLSRLKVDPKATRRGNYESGSDYVLEYGELRFAFNEEDFAQRVEQAAVKL